MFDQVAGFLILLDRADVDPGAVERVADDLPAGVRELLDQAVSSPNLNECVELYRQAEAEILADHCFIPLFYKQRYLICKNGVSDVVFNPFSGQVRFTDARYYVS